MSDVELLFNNEFEHEYEEVFERLIELDESIISKDIEKLQELLDESFILRHMSGKIQSKEEFLDELSGNILNYFKSSMYKPTITIHDDEAEVLVDNRLKARVYGIDGEWTLHSTIILKKINQKWYFIKWLT